MIAVVLQYHPGDMQQARELVRFIAALEPELEVSKRRTDVRFRLVGRADAKHMEPEILSELGSKFDISWATTEYAVSGWPQGPNAMALEILGTAPKWLHENGWSPVNGVLLLEPDHVPLSRDWLKQIIAAWEPAQEAGAWCMGSWRNSGGPWGHINGGAIYRPDFAQLTRLRNCPEDLAWDCFAANSAHKHWCVSGLFLNKFQSRNATEAELRTPEIGATAPVLVHGYKDKSAMSLAKAWTGVRL